MLLLHVPAFILRNLEVPTWYLSQPFLRFHAVSAMAKRKKKKARVLMDTLGPAMVSPQLIVP
jgi:hypothetical protein